MLSPQQLIGIEPSGAPASAAYPVLGLIDGPVHSGHPDFKGASIRLIDKTPSTCSVNGSPACVHGTFVAGILCAGAETQKPGICPGSTIISRSLFCEAGDLRQCPVVTPQHLADALSDVLDAGARVVNLSLGLAQASLGGYENLHSVFDKAYRSGAIVVGASGNQGRVGHNPLFDHHWVIPVAACNMQGRIIAQSNIGKSVGQRGLLAPGDQIESLHPSGGFTRLTGTSAAAPFVTGGIARLWALYPQATAAQIRNAALRGAGPRRGIIPPLFQFKNSQQLLQQTFSRQRTSPSHHTITL